MFETRAADHSVMPAGTTLADVRRMIRDGSLRKGVFQTEADRFGSPRLSVRDA